MAANSLIDELVHQFTDPFAFYRELIQNGIDAGSKRIEVELSFRPATPKGLALISVSDWGEGMTRKTIEEYLVTKFRSTKENDLTKIGKFGIGFVSIFACAPDAVSVETGRDGEFWRVLFRADTTWELFRLDTPVEGTRITLHKRMGPADYEEFVARSSEAVSRWCKHTEADVAFTAGAADGSAPPPPRSVVEPLTVDAPFQVEHREDGTHIVAGPARSSPARTGLYNRGLTLLETDERFIPGVNLKIVSRYLEHTLTRDNVRRDRHFSRAVALAHDLVDRALLPRLVSELAAAAQRKDGRADFELLFRFAEGRLKPKQLTYRLTGGGPIAHDALVAHVKTAGFLTVSKHRTPLVDRLLDAKWPVLEVERGTPLSVAITERLKLEGALVADEYFTYAAPPDEPTPSLFGAALLELLGANGATALETVEVSAVRGSASAEPWVLLDALSRPMPDPRVRASAFDRNAPPLLCLNRQHPALSKAVPLFTSAPRLAAVLVARLLLVRHGRLTEARDQALTRWALT